MKHLHELIQFHSKVSFSLKGGKQNPFEKKLKGLSLKLYSSIKQNKFETEEDALADLYNLKMKSSTKKFQMLKSRLISQLVNDTAQFDINKLSSDKRFKSIYEVYRYSFLARSIEAAGSRGVSVQMAKKAVKLSRHYEFFDQAIIHSRILMHHYALEGDAKMFEYYAKQMSESIKILDVELQAETAYYRLVFRQIRFRTANIELIDEAKQQFLRLKEKLKKYHSFTSYVFYYRIGLAYYQLIRNYSKALLLCKKFENLIEKSTHASERELSSEVSLIKLACFRNLEKNKEGLKAAQTGSTLFREGGYNWFVFHEQYLLLATHMSDFTLAWEIYKKVSFNASFHLQPPVIRDYWRLIEAYLALFSPAGREINREEILRFLNEDTSYSADKKGFMTSLKIAQIFFMIEDREFNLAEGMIEALRLFVRRNFNTKNAERTILFCRMLKTISSYGFIENRARLFTKSNLAKLKASKSSAVENTHSEEIIPYEIMYEGMMKLLSRK